MKKRLQRLGRWFQCNGLFLEVLTLTVAGLILAGSLTLAFAWRSAERFYLENISRSSRQSLNLVAKEMEEWTQDHMTILTTLQSDWATKAYLTLEDPSSADAMNTTYHLITKLDSLKVVNEDSLRLPLVLTDRNGNIKYTYGYSGITLSAVQISTAAYSRAARENPGEIRYTFTSQGPSPREGDRNCVVMSASLRQAKEQVTYGYLYIIITQEQLSKAYRDMSNPASRLLLISEDGMVVSAEDQQLVGQVFPELLEAVELHTQQENDAPVSLVFQERDVSILGEKISPWGLYGVAVIDQNMAAAYVGESYQEMLFVCLGVTLLVMLAFFLRMRRRFAPPGPSYPSYGAGPGKGDFCSGGGGRRI